MQTQELDVADEWDKLIDEDPAEDFIGAVQQQQNEWMFDVFETAGSAMEFIMGCAIVFVVGWLLFDRWRRAV